MFDSYKNDAVRRRLRNIDEQFIKHQSETFDDKIINRIDGEYSPGFDSQISTKYKKQVPKIGGGGMRILEEKSKIPLFSNLVNEQDNINMKKSKLLYLPKMEETPLYGYEKEYINNDLDGAGVASSIMSALKTALPYVKKSLPVIKAGLTVGKTIAQSIDNDKAQKIGNVLESLGFGEQPIDTNVSARTRRGQKIKEIMKLKGLSLIEASKYIKANNIKY